MTRSRAATLWALLGVTLLLADGCARLALRALHELRARSTAPTAFEWLAFVAIAVAFAYGEGHLALQRRFVPAVVTRALGVGACPVGWRTIAAPLVALGLVGATRATVVRTWLGLAAIVGAAVAVRALPNPWRAMVDGGVSVALAWGLVALWGRYFVETVRRPA